MNLLLSFLPIALALPPASVAFFAAVVTGIATVSSSERALQAASENGILEATGRLSVLQSSTAADLMASWNDSRLG